MEILGIGKLGLLLFILNPMAKWNDSTKPSPTIWRNIFHQIKKIGIVGFPCSFYPIGLLNMKQLAPAEVYFGRDLRLPLDLL